MKLQELGLLDASLAMALTVVVPTGKTEPETGLLVTVTPEQVSFAVTAG